MKLNHKTHKNAIAIFLYGLLLAAVSNIKAEDIRNHKKRQIFREQVLPHAGGRIPDTAFETDRLFLNRLQKEGIAVPDGIVLEQRNPQVYPFQVKNSRTVFHIALSTDDRLIAKEGRYHYDKVPTIETTYLYPQIHEEKATLTPTTPAYPIYRQLQIHNSQVNQAKFQPKKKAQQLHSTGTATVKGPVKQQKTTSYQNFNLVNLPLQHSPPANVATSRLSQQSFQPYYGIDSQQYLPSYESTNLFNDFEDLLNSFELYDSSPDSDQLYNQIPSIDLPVTGFGNGLLY